MYGKLTRRTVTAPTDSPPLLEIAALLGALKCKFIVDTGASISIIPNSYLNGVELYPTPVKISSADGSEIHCSGQVDLEIAIPCLRRSFNWTFIVAGTTHPLLGLDFLQYYGLLIDCQNNIVRDPKTDCIANLTRSTYIMNIIVNDYDIDPMVKSIIKKEVPNIILPHTKERGMTGVYHRIETGSNPPVFARPRRLAEEKYRSAKTDFQRLLTEGTIRISKSQWSSPLHLVKKTDGKYRSCGDYRSLNSITKIDRYPIPNVNAMSSKLYNKYYFSKIDLVSAYHQIPVHPDDIPKTAITTPFGLYEYKFMPFGLKNASATFQRFMDSLFSGVSCVFTYIDDILVFSEDEESHINDIREVLKILDKHDLKISLNKCLFNVRSLKFLGYTVSSEGIKPPEEKLNELNNFPCPIDSKSLRRLLGMLNFYRKLVPKFAEIVLPLTEKIRLFPNAKNFDMTKEEKQSIDRIKKVLSELSPLPHPISNVVRYQLVTDSSQYAIGAALNQMVNNEPIPIGFYSCKLTQPQQRYSAFDRELLAAYNAVMHFKYQIEGREVLLITDHKPLCSAFKSLKPAKSDRQQRHLGLLTEYINDISFIKGNHNVVADCLSRPANAIIVDVCDLPEISVKQNTDSEIHKFKDSLKNYVISPGKSILCDVSTPYPRPYVPVDLRKSIFDSFHSISHAGIKSSIKLIKARFFWPCMDTTIKNWCRECVPCQQSKINKHTRSFSEFLLPSARFQTVHIDIVGPLPIVKDQICQFTPYRYLLTCIDRATRWIEACPLIDITASTVAHAFINTWISRFGVPLYVITDRGTQFESELFGEISRIIGFHTLRTTSYHPETNGMIERSHRSIKTAITAKKEVWISALPVVLLGLRSVSNENGISPFSAVTGTEILLPKIMVDSEHPDDFSSEHARKLQKEMAMLDIDALSKGISHSINKSYVPKQLSNCDKVWVRIDRVRKPLEAPYSGPYTVIKRLQRHFIIALSDKVHNTVSLDRLKPFITTSVKTDYSVAKAKPVVEDTVDTNCEDTLPNLDSRSENKDRKSRYGRKLKFRQAPEYNVYF